MYPPSRQSSALHQYQYRDQPPQFDPLPRPSSRPSLASLGLNVASSPGFQHTHTHSYSAYQHLGPFGDTRTSIQTRSSSALAEPLGGPAAGAERASAFIVRDLHARSSVPLPRYSTPPITSHRSLQMVHPPQSTQSPPASNSSVRAADLGSRPPREVTPTMWDDEGVLCYMVSVGDNVVSRRFDNDWVNCTKAMNIVGLSRGKRDGLLKHEEQRLVVRRGSKQLKGVWLPLNRARALAESQGISDSLYPILEDNIESFLYTSDNRSRTQHLVEMFAALRDSRRVQELKLSNETDEAHAERCRRMSVLKSMVAEVERKLEETRSVAGSTRRAASVAKAKKESPTVAKGTGQSTPREEDKSPCQLASPPTSLPAISSSQGAYFHPPSPPHLHVGRGRATIPPNLARAQAQKTSAPPISHRPYLAPLAPVDPVPVTSEEIEPFVFYNNITPQALEGFSFGSDSASVASEMNVAEGEKVVAGAPIGFDPQVFSKVPIPARRHSFPQVAYTPRFTFPFDEHQVDEEARRPPSQGLDRTSRRSLDSAASFLFPGVGLGPSSLVAPSTVLYAPDPSFAHPPQPQPLPHTLDPRQAFSPPYPSPISSTTFSLPSVSSNCDWNVGGQSAPQHRLLRRRSTYSPEHEAIDETVALESTPSQYSNWALEHSQAPLYVDESFSFSTFPTSFHSAKAVGEQGSVAEGVEMARASSAAGITLVGSSAGNDLIGAVRGDLASEGDGIAEQAVGDNELPCGGRAGVKRSLDWDTTVGEQKTSKRSVRRASVAW